MSKLNEGGYIEDFVTGFFAMLVILFFVGVFGLLIFSKWEWSEDNVSGIVYNTQNNKAVSGNTTFSIRAGENTPVTEENKSSYCLPPNSPYKDLVNRAAGDKRIKVQITTSKGFWVKSPFTCVANVTVTEVK
jgi:hypothetical protein